MSDPDHLKAHSWPRLAPRSKGVSAAKIIARVDAATKLELLRRSAHELVPYSDIVRAALTEKFARERSKKK